MMDEETLVAAEELAGMNEAGFRYASAEYREARNELLAEEIRLRRHLRLYSDASADYSEDYVGDRDADTPAYTVFTRSGGSIRHFYSCEGSIEMSDPGQDPHNAPDMNPLWILLDTTPEGRGTDWYPSLGYR